MTPFDPNGYFEKILRPDEYARRITREAVDRQRIIDTFGHRELPVQQKFRLKVFIDKIRSHWPSS